MMTMYEAIEQASEWGVRCAESTFWKYQKLGLISKGNKIPGRGNVSYYPDDTPLTLYSIQGWTALGFPLELLSKHQWILTDVFVSEFQNDLEQGKTLPHIKTVDEIQEEIDSISDDAKKEINKKSAAKLLAGIGIIRSLVVNALTGKTAPSIKSESQHAAKQKKRSKKKQ